MTQNGFLWQNSVLGTTHGAKSATAKFWQEISWLHVFLDFFTPFRWPRNSLECVFIFHYSEWKSSAKLSSHSWAGWYPSLLQAVSETRKCECSEAIMSVVQFVVSTHRTTSWAWPPRLAELFCTYWCPLHITRRDIHLDISIWELHQLVAETNSTNCERCTFLSKWQSGPCATPESLCTPGAGQSWMPACNVI